MLRFAGFLVLFAGMFGGFVLAGGRLLALWQPAEIIIIAGAALGAFMVSNPVSVQKMTLTHLHYVLVKNHEFEKDFFLDLLKLLYRLVDLQRRDGVAGIENHIEDPANSDLFSLFPRIMTHERLLHFITDNFRVSGLGNISMHQLESLMDHEMHSLSEDLKRPGKALQSTADACPGFGIIAAVMGIVVTMGALDGPIELIGVKIAAALVGTLVGILLCYGIIGPLASAVDHTAKNEILAFDCVKVVLVSSLSGSPPLMSVDAGRRSLYKELRPTFFELEAWLKESS